MSQGIQKQIYQYTVAKWPIFLNDQIFLNNSKVDDFLSE